MIMNFLMEHWRTILLVYAVVGGLVFLGVLLFVVHALCTDEEAKYCDDYSESGNRVISFVLGLLVGLPCGLLWPFVPVLLIGLWIFATVVETFPHLMRHLADEEEGDTEHGTYGKHE